MYQLLIGLVVFLSIAKEVHSQEIYGVLSRGANHLIRGALVTATCGSNENQATTDSSGMYRIDTNTAATCDLRIDVDGIRARYEPRIFLSSGQTARYDFELVRIGNSYELYRK